MSSRPAPARQAGEGAGSSSALAQQQQALVAALWERRPADALARVGAHVTPGPLAERGLRAYRSNGRELAVRALAAAYPAVAALLGDENFEAVAHRLWLLGPPSRGDMACWGEALAPWLAAEPDLAREEPYLADVAQVEWALHVAATAPDAIPDGASFALLQTHDPSAFRLTLAPGTRVHTSAWPVASLVLAHIEGSPTLDEAAARLRAHVAESALVWREGLRPRLRELAADEVPFVQALLARHSLADALESAPALAFDRWLAPAVQAGLVIGAVLI